MSALREFMYRKVRNTQFKVRSIAGGDREMPHFLVIGAQKSGTSSIFSYLKQHPQILRPILKEPYFFDRHYDRGLKWYGCNFPSRRTIEGRNDRFSRKHVTFEATATYVFDPEVPARISATIAARKFILLLRNPVERAISAYWHAKRMGLESRSLNQALEEDIHYFHEAAEWEKGTGPEPKGPAPRSFVRRGIYHEAVSRWQSVFSPENLLVLQSETMFADPKASMVRVFDFLDLPQVDRIDFEAQNVGGYRNSDPEARRILANFYRPHNLELNRISRTTLAW